MREGVRSVYGLRVLAAVGVLGVVIGLLPLAAGAQVTPPDQPGTGTSPGGDSEAETAQTADSPIAFERQAGATRYQTAAEVATARFSAPQTEVVIASGEDFADALAGAALEGDLGAPVLLVPSTLQDGAIPSAITDAIDELGATNATLLGGEDAISTGVEEFIEDNSTVTDSSRVSGSTRFETAEEIANQVSASPIPEALSDQLGLGGGDLAFVATGLGFADALAAGAGAYQGPHPVLLTGPDELHPAAERGLEASGADTVIVLGGNSAVSSSVEAELGDAGYETERLAGENRWETSTEVADALADGFGFGVADVGLATGLDFADALASAPYLGELPAPLVLTPGDETHDAPDAWFDSRGCDIETIHVFGGQSALQDAVAEAYAETACHSDGADALLSGESVENLQAEGSGQDQDFSFTVESATVGVGDVVTIDVAAADAENADYSGASVDATSGAGTAAFAPATGEITYTGATGEDAVGDEVTITLQGVDATAAQAGLEVTFERDAYSNTVTFDIEG